MTRELRALGPLTCGQYLALANVGAGTPERMKALSDARLLDCVGAAAAVQLRSKRESAS